MILDIKNISSGILIASTEANQDNIFNKDMYEVERSGLKNFIELYETEIHRDFNKRLDDAITYFEMVKQSNESHYVDNYEGILLVYNSHGDTFFVEPDTLVNKLLYGERDNTLVRSIDLNSDVYANFRHNIFHWNQVAEYYLKQIGANYEQKD